MTPFVLSGAAEADLDEIREYLVTESGADAAVRVLDSLRRAILRLARFPNKGHWRPDLTDEPMLFWSVQGYMIVYKPGTDPLAIARVLHGARDIQVIMRDDPEAPFA